MGKDPELSAKVALASERIKWHEECEPTAKKQRKNEKETETPEGAVDAEVETGARLEEEPDRHSEARSSGEPVQPEPEAAFAMRGRRSREDREDQEAATGDATKR